MPGVLVMIRAFVEAPAGLAAVSLRLHGGQHCRPPISRMGNKAGYSAVILAALGLRSGEGAGAYVWAESDPDVRALLRAYPDADTLCRIADIIRGWKDEEPRALWERLRAERKARGPAVEPDEVAAMCWIQRRSAHGKGDGYHPGNETHKIEADAPADACHRLAEYAHITASSRMGTGGFLATCRGNDGIPNDPRRPVTPTEVASGFERVAGWLTEHALTIPQAQVRGATDSDFNGGKAQSMAGLSLASSRLASRWPPVAVLAAIPDAATLSAMLGTPGDLEGVVILSDPPYENTTGYADDLPRSDVVRFALDWAAMGAHVCVCEQEPIPALVDAGWYATRITDGRRGQRRTFSRQSEEYLTLNRPSAHTVAKQVSMFGGAA